MAEDGPLNYEELEKAYGDSEEMPSMEELLKMMNTSELEEQMQLLRKAMHPPGSGTNVFLALSLGAFLFSVILFFGYKLYKSIKEKELKKDEKRKAKQMKKKK